MDPARSDERSVLSLLREVQIGRLTGVLKAEHQDGQWQFTFVDGQLYLPDAHSQAARLHAIVDAARSPNGSSERGTLAQQRADLVERLAATFSLLREGRFALEELAQLSADGMEGPVPIGSLIMAVAVAGLSDDELLRRLGGQEAWAQSHFDPHDLESGLSPWLEPEEMFLLSRAERPVRVTELLRQLGTDRGRAIRTVARLHAGRLLETTTDEQRQRDGEKKMIDSMVARFRERIGKRLQEKALELPAEEHRRRLAHMIAEVGSMTHYEVLDIGLHDSEERVYEAYDRLAREVHPSHVERLGLVGKESAIDLLFERATIAYLTLADAERRAAYNREAGIEPGSGPSPAERNVEELRMARDNYQRALQLVESGDYHFALELARQAVRAEQRAEYFALLGRIEGQNPNWLNRAADCYRRAIRLDPDQPQYRVELAKLLEASGDVPRAKVHYRAALQMDPRNTVAIEALQRLADSTVLATTIDERRGWLERLRDWFR